MDESKNADFQLEELNAKAKSGANWFYWIAVLSLVNSIAAFTGSDWRFIIGLGLSQVVDALVIGIVGDTSTIAKLIALAFDVFIAGGFALFAWCASRHQSWAFIVGLIIYTLDGLLFVFVQDWISIGFHAFALFSIFCGYKASKQYLALTVNNTVLRPVESAPPVAS